MKHAIRRWSCFTVLCFLLVSSCATTTLTAVWKDPGVHGTIRKVVVVGTFRTSATRDLVMSKAKEAGADAILVTRLMGKRTVSTYVPGQPYVVPDYYYRWGPYYQYVYTPGYMAEEEYAYAETNIYNTSNNMLIWSARSETQLAGRRESTIESFVRTIVDRLSADKLIG
jgi:hypothetical protein